jgi:glycosyltransferase involved in cell wall biosynthesis
MPILTIGMACYKNFEQVWFTVQALRLYQDLTDVEVLLIDNYGQDNSIKDFTANWLANSRIPVRYVSWTEVQGPANAKNRVFEEAAGEWVMCIDSHVLLDPGSVLKFKDWINVNNDSRNLYHGPLLYDDLATRADAMSDTWHGSSWGVWRNSQVKPTDEPYTIPMHGMGLFACRKDAWLGFNPTFKGFGGEEGYIHTKYRQAGAEVILLPFLRWAHFFQTRGGVVTAPYTPYLHDKIRNYKIGFLELKLDLQPLYDAFGKESVDSCVI